MQHLRHVYDSKWLRTVTVGYFDTLNHCCTTKQLWTYDNFVSFPKKHGYRIDENYRLHPSGKRTSCVILDRPAFDQAWLFFQLIYCVVRKQEEPFLDYEKLVSDGKLDTSTLPGALNEWHKHMHDLHKRDPGAAIMRFLEANQILELAKQVVLANLAENSPFMLVPQHTKRYEKGNRANELSEERNLCIMILGETLSAVLTRMMRTCKVNLPGWELDDGGGWGPPAYVSRMMFNDEWCPRSQATVKGQLGRNATLLYVTVLAHENNRHNRHHNYQHSQRCTSSKCKFIEASDSPLDSSRYPIREYRPSHSLACSATDSVDNKDCGMIGPNEDEILDVLERSDHPRTGVFPLIRILEDKETKDLKLKVEKWKAGTPYATISHVWSQGLGNRNKREIHVCQLRAIGNLLKQVFGEQESYLFWLDTFAIPQRGTGETRHAQLKRKAIGLIHHIFNNAQHCIILDRYLMMHGRAFDHNCRNIGAEILASGWMMRLWTLQEAFTTRNPGEETLALSSLLDIPIPQDDESSVLSTSREEDRERLMERFWETVGKDDDFGQSIPPGIIFLPGKRLSSEGFRWAPFTWMSGEVEAYPFPLDNPKHPTKLTSKGLVVQLPGFCLYPTRDKLCDIISTSNRSSFKFSVGRGLDEWYQVSAARRRSQLNDISAPLDNGNHDLHPIALELRKDIDSGKPLKIGIILSRPRPVEVQGEIGLLVKICDSEDRCPLSGRNKPLLTCKIIRRIEVSRLAIGASEIPPWQTGSQEAHGYDPILSRYERFKREKVAGVQLDDAQSWCVDGFPGKTPTTVGVKRSQTDVVTARQPKGFLSKLKRVMTSGSRFESSDL
uniref:Heterokaryon incompatibility domain-containing protein n=1 Tax=Fusarium oxysporum (strain Fo5176) TaxID=660025 RepID=A0A0D2Y320_FUSOF